MRKRQVILALAAVLALAVAIPAIGSPSPLFNLATHANNRAERALHRSNRALNRARLALRRGRNARLNALAANATANNAAVTANGTAQTANGTAQQLAGTKIVSDGQAATVNTNSMSYVSLGGPTVQVTVPQSGLVDLWASVDIEDDSDGGAVAVFEDGQLVPDQAELCDPDINRALLLWEGTGGGGPVRLATPSAVIGAGGGCGTFGLPAPVLIETTPGDHTFELRYADPCPCGTSQFSNRVLRVGPRL